MKFDGGLPVADDAMKGFSVRLTYHYLYGGVRPVAMMRMGGTSGRSAQLSRLVAVGISLMAYPFSGIGALFLKHYIDQHGITKNNLAGSAAIQCRFSSVGAAVLCVGNCYIHRRWLHGNDCRLVPVAGLAGQRHEDRTYSAGRHRHG